MAEQRRKQEIAQRRAAAQQRRVQAEQQARIAEQQRRQEQAAAAARQREAQQRRAQAEQQARIKQQELVASRRARSEAATKRRLQRVQHTVRKGEGPAEIAAATGATEQDVANLPVNRFVPGQVLDLTVEGPEVAQPQGTGPVTPGRAGVGIIQKVAEGFLDFVNTHIATSEDETGTKLDPYGIARLAPPPEGGNKFQDAFGDSSFEAYGPMVGTGEEQEFGTYYQGDFVPPGTPAARSEFNAADPEYGSVEQQEPWTIDWDKPMSAQQKALNMDILAARWEYKAIEYALQTGDMEARPDYLSRFFIDTLSYDQQIQLMEKLGYAIDENGRFIAQDIPEVGYGMGGYGDYDYGVGGGGDYEPPRTTVARAVDKAGGRVQTKSGRITAGYVPSSHWRI
jgi:flagellar biosynthesis GTPase FlhF